MAVNNKSRTRDNKYWQGCWAKRTLCTVGRDVASSSITSLHIDRGKVETLIYFIFLGFKMTVNSDCRHKIKRHFLKKKKKRHLLLRRKATTNLDSVLKSRDISLPTKVYLVKAMVFPVVMYGCESWTIKKAEHWPLMLLNCGVREDSWESLRQCGVQTSQS